MIGAPESIAGRRAVRFRYVAREFVLLGPASGSQALSECGRSAATFDELGMLEDVRSRLAPGDLGVDDGFGRPGGEDCRSGPNPSCRLTKCLRSAPG
jgi:hypothetical protein